MKQINVKLVKLSKNKNAMRTRTVRGWCFSLPRPGWQFRMYAPPLDPRAVERRVTTSPVTHVYAEPNGRRVFQTHNTTYAVAVLKK